MLKFELFIKFMKIKAKEDAIHSWLLWVRERSMRLLSAFTLVGIALATIDAGKASNSTHEETASEDEQNGSVGTNFKVIGNYFYLNKFIFKICEILGRKII
jgi:hypothetical protein